MPSKNQAMGYTDYYKKNSVAPSDSTGPNLSSNKKPDVDEVAERRKAAIQRRLRMRKAGK